VPRRQVQQRTQGLRAAGVPIAQGIRIDAHDGLAGATVVRAGR
jgi:hypothetical protein